MVEKNYKIGIECRKENFNEIFELIYRKTVTAISVSWYSIRNDYILWFCDKGTSLNDIRNIFKSLEENGYKLSDNIVDVFVKLDFGEYPTVFAEKA